MSTVDPQTLFVTALLHQDIDVVTELLESAKIDPNLPLPSGKSPLVEVIQKKSLPLVELLVKHGASPDQECQSYLPAGWVNQDRDPAPSKLYPLREALKTQDAKILDVLLSAGANHRLSGLTVTEMAVMAVSEMQNTDIVFPCLMKLLKNESKSPLSYKASLDRILVVAVQGHNQKLLAVLLTEGANPNYVHEGLPVLVLAANNINKDACQVLLENGANLNRLKFIEDELPLSAAIRAGWPEAVKTLIQLGADVKGMVPYNTSQLNLIQPSARTKSLNHLNVQNLTFLHFAVIKRNTEITKELLQAGCPIRQAGKHNNTPLHLACQDESDPYALVGLMLEYTKAGSDVIDVKNSMGYSALFLAIQSGCVNCAGCLVTAGAGVNTTDSAGQSALQKAIHMCSEEMVSIILSKGASVNSASFQGCTPVIRAVLVGDYTITCMLIDEGADLTVLREGTQESALHVAVVSQSEEILEVLLEGGKLNINGQTTNGETPLMLAARRDDLGLCKLLIRNGALLDLTDFNQQETALSLSVYFGKEDNACHLIKEGANMEQADHRGFTPMYWAFFNSRVTTVAMLVMAGARLTLKDLRNKYPTNLRVKRDKPLMGWLVPFLSNSRSLQDCARQEIRKALCAHAGGKGIGSLIGQFHLPDKMKDYLLFNNESTCLLSGVTSD